MSIDPSRNPSVTDQALAMCKVIEALRTDAGDDLLRSIVTQNWGRPEVLERKARDTKNPARVLISFGDTIIALYEGVSNRTQAIGMSSQYLSVTSITPPFLPAHPWVSSLCVDTMAPELAAFRPTCRNLVLGGHSMGGAIAQWLHVAVSGLTNYDRVVSGTFGSPMWGFQNQANQLNASSSTRWMLPDDPITAVWPSITEAPVMNALAGAGGIIARRYVHCGQGLQMQPDSTFVSRYHADLSGQIAEADLINLFFSDMNQEDNAHWIANYTAWFQLEVDLLTPVQAIPEPPPVRFRTIAPPIEEAPIRQQNVAVQQGVRQRLRTQIGIPVAIPRSELFIAKKRGPTWAVYFMDAEIGWGMRRRRALHLANFGNRMMMQYLRVGVAYPDAFVRAMAQFCLDAQVPATGITPTLNVDPIDVRAIGRS